MQKEELLKELSERITSGEISKEEVLRLVNTGTLEIDHVEAAKKWFAHMSLTKILYILGAAIVALGIIFFVAQIWEQIGSFGRIAITFILGILMAVLGSYLYVKEESSKLGHVFHVIGGILIPSGAMVVLSELSQGVVSLWPIAITIGVIFLFYLLLTFYHKTIILTFFAIANGSAFTYLLVESILLGPSYLHMDVYAYITMIIGISYLLLAYSFRNTWNAQLSGLLAIVGSFGFFAAAFSQVFDSTAWQLIFFILAVGGMAIAVYGKSRAILIASSVFLVAHFVFITQEYFADSIGWPLSLVVLGFVLIGLGYVSITINKKYLKSDHS